MSTALDPSLRVYDAVAPLSRLHQFRVLFFEDLKVALSFPIPDRVGGEDEIHFLEGALVGFGVEGPHDNDGGGVNGAEEVKSFFLELSEDCGEEKNLFLFRQYENTNTMKSLRKTYCPAVANRPTHHTPCIASSSDLQWKDLGWVQPRYGQPRRSENDRVKEHEENGPTTHAGSVSPTVLSIDGSAGETTRAKHADPLAN